MQEGFIDWVKIGGIFMNIWTFGYSYNTDDVLTNVRGYSFNHVKGYTIYHIINKCDGTCRLELS